MQTSVPVEVPETFYDPACWVLCRGGGDPTTVLHVRETTWVWGVKAFIKTQVQADTGFVKRWQIAILACV